MQQAQNKFVAETESKDVEHPAAEQQAPVELSDEFLHLVGGGTTETTDSPGRTW